MTPPSARQWIWFPSWQVTIAVRRHTSTLFLWRYTPRCTTPTICWLLRFIARCRRRKRIIWRHAIAPCCSPPINVGNQLSRRVWASASFDAGQRQQIADYLVSYDKIATQIGDLDAEIRSLFKEFDLQDQAVNPISEELISLAKAEVERAQAKLERTSQWTTIVIFSVVAGALALAASIVRLLHVSFTRNVVKLTKAVGELQSGKVATQADIDSGDELGRLASGIQRHGGAYQDSDDESLQEQAAIAESRLYHAIESMT